MGRRPNPLVSEFFERGRKLDDASNRYEQTCKFCREKFPKGRVDALIAHVVKKCPAVPSQDRQRAVIQFSQPSPRDEVPTSNGANDLATGLAPIPDLSALETLAEVSRHHLDYQTQILYGDTREVIQRVVGTEQRSPKRRKIQGKRQQVIGQLQHCGEVVAGDGHASQQYLSQTDAEAQSLAQALYEAHGTSHPDPASEFLVQEDLGKSDTVPGPDSASATATAATSLQLTASAASELIGPPTFNTSPADLKANGSSPLVLSSPRIHASAQNIDPQLEGDTGIVADTGKGQALRLLASKSPAEEGLTDSARQKARGKFTESRRKEVQNVRKLGACMRCRMLKKPCSDGTPCKQCVKIDSARLWRQPCFRTRLHEEFTLWSCGLFTIRAFRSVSRVKGLLHFETAPGRLETRVFPETLMWSTFAALKASNPPGNAHHPIVLRNDRRADLNDIFMLATEAEDVLAKMEGYLRQLTLGFCEVEPSDFMRATLKQGRELALNQSAALLLSVMELWLCTRLLCGDLALEIFHNASDTPSSGPVMDYATSKEQHRIALTSEGYQTSSELIITQLSAAVEKRAAVLAKFVLSELERRLVQRQQSLSFETFLVSVIFLACAGKMCTLYHSFEHRNATAAHPRSQVEDGRPASVEIEPTADAALHSLEETLLRAAGVPVHEAAPAAPPDWPLEHPPAYFYRQGDRLSDILHMLLRMRGIIPTSVVNEENVISPADTAQITEAKEWFGAVHLTDGAISSTAQMGAEMRYVGKLLDR